MSADGSVLATYTQRFSDQFAHESLSLQTWFPSGYRLVTTSSPFPAPQLDPHMLVAHVPVTTDAATMLRRHGARCDRYRQLGAAQPISSAEDLARLVSESWTSELRVLIERRLCQLEGDRVRGTRRFAWAVFWEGIDPLRPGYGPLQYFVGVLAPAALALAMFGFGAAGSPLAALLPWLAGGLMGAAAGAIFWTRALVWTVAVPLLVSYAAGQDLASSGTMVLAALLGSEVGFQTSAGRAQARGRRALANRMRPDGGDSA